MQRIKHHPDDMSQKFLKLRNSLISATGKAIGDYNMIEDGDTVLVCMSDTFMFIDNA